MLTLDRERPADAALAGLQHELEEAESISLLAAIWIAAREHLARWTARARRAAWTTAKARALAMGWAPDRFEAIVRECLVPRVQLAEAWSKTHTPDLPEWMATAEAMLAHVRAYKHPIAVESSARKWGRVGGSAFREALAMHLVDLSFDPTRGQLSKRVARGRVAMWAAEGPKKGGAQ